MTLEINLDNDAMQTFGEVKTAIANSFRGYSSDESTQYVGDQENILDSNGNKVGKWEIVPDRFGE